MEMLNSLSIVLANDLWTTLIDLFSKWIINYGWAIIVFTICLKLVMSPLDILQRSASQKQAKVTAAMQPEMAKLQEKYGNDRERLNQEQAKLYKKHNVNLGGMCFSMLITMVISLVVFFTLYGSLRSYGDQKLIESYASLDKAYVQAEQVAVEKGYAVDSAEYNAVIVESVKDKYESQSKQNSWLWVKNVWKGDTKTSQFVSFEEFAKEQGYDETQKAVAKARYDEIVVIIDGENEQQNGYYILIILSAVISFLTQFLTQKLITPKGQKMNMMNMIMFAVIPITMVILAMTSNVVFTLYVIANSVMSAIISTIIALVMKNKNKGNDGDIVLSKKKVEVVEYSRNYKK